MGEERESSSGKRSFRSFDALFRARFSSIKHDFTLFGKSRRGMDFFVARFAY